MKIYKNSTWQQLCTRSWDKDEEHLTCKTMGYSNNGVDDNGTWYTDNNNSSNTSIHHNCSSLTKCGKNIDNNLQLCKGALAEFIGSHVKDEGNPFVMYGVTCTGDESELASCARIDGNFILTVKMTKGAQALCEPMLI
ncbi:hypothetical protein OS493_030576 [Desmophyllum pertusum]|uniref:SRCR domain-containing protein n=1 Tax=Desmophyllum pertusum TaxID=174260 RepID=A0A9W9Y8T8_9CNID|nr:hypothetical protein OS493_030576 [Desmophyllum pertusum]